VEAVTVPFQRILCTNSLQSTTNDVDRNLKPIRPSFRVLSTTNISQA
jgi:hypothetical protein